MKIKNIGDEQYNVTNALIVLDFYFTLINAERFKNRLANSEGTSKMIAKRPSDKFIFTTLLSLKVQVSLV